MSGTAPRFSIVTVNRGAGANTITSPATPGLLPNLAPDIRTWFLAGGGRGGGQEPFHLGVADLPEVGVEGADGEETRRRVRTDHRVGVLGQYAGGLHGADRH